MALFKRAAMPSLRFSPGVTSSIISIRRASSMAPPKLNDPSLFKQNACYVNGEWRAAKSGKTFKVNDPSTGEFIGTSPEFDVADTKSAIIAAADAFPSFRAKTGRERAKLLRRWFDELNANAEDIAKLITWENGKPINDAKGESTYAASFLEWFSEEAPRIYGDTINSSNPANRIITVKEPVGVCGLITPWNFPAAMITRKVAPALAAGCTVVCKAPAETPFTALALAELAHRAGIPKGVVNIVTALDNTIEIGKLLTTSPTINKVSFTGSTGVGKILMKQSSDTLKKLSMELGGNAPFIVFDDADVDAAVAGAIVSKFRSSGQTCVCANRLYVQSGIYDQFIQKFTEAVKSFSVGNGFDEGITHGPLIHDRAVDKVDSHVRDAEKKGATVTIGGQKLPNLGVNFFQPTVIRDMTVDMAIATEETFGPVAGVFSFETEAEVVSLANQADVGLAGYFFSRDISRVFRVAEALEVGMVGVNTGLISDPASPFGGVKESGFGREGSKYGLAEFQTIKSVTFGDMGKPLQGKLANLPVRQCLNCIYKVQKRAILAASWRASSFPASQATSLAPTRFFSTSQQLQKKRKIAAPKGSRHDEADVEDAPSGKRKGGAPPPSASNDAVEEIDPLDFTALINAFGPIDAHFKAQLQALSHGGRFNPTNLGALTVHVTSHAMADDASGAMTTVAEDFPLSELAQIVPRSGRTISLLVHDRSYIKPIMSAVQASPDYNQQPQRSEDNDLELLLKVEMERKEDVARRVKETTQVWRERVRAARTKHEKVIKDWKKNKTITSDVARKADKELQKLQDKKMKEIDGEETKAISSL
ncbi:unnamed protein product [Clonostachys rosea]|uniref:Succinate-semialdehyde dehydrogenase, mitochondrial n=1 Tax=Bionectria ochroleuca TaxID=29856 RepID=A0ABY6UF16_BIOOC|nr:unnamed protein product [Clonostachys rosea]